MIGTYLYNFQKTVDLAELKKQIKKKHQQTRSRFLLYSPDFEIINPGIIHFSKE